MKSILFLMLIPFAYGFAQDAEDENIQEEEISREDVETVEGDTVEAPQEQQPRPSTQISEPQKNIFQIECTCPEREQAQQEVSTVNSVFPPDTVFFIAPQPGPVPSAQEQEAPAQQENVPPGYGGKLPQGYSDDTYRQIE